jgi:hypothetical protein
MARGVPDGPGEPPSACTAPNYPGFLVRQMLGSSPSMTWGERFQPRAMAYRDAYADELGQLIKALGVPDGPDEPGHDGVRVAMMV